MIDAIFIRIKSTTTRPDRTGAQRVCTSVNTCTFSRSLKSFAPLYYVGTSFSVSKTSSRKNVFHRATNELPRKQRWNSSDDGQTFRSVYDV